MPEKFFGYSCNICHTRYFGTGAKAAADACEALGYPDLIREEGQTFYARLGWSTTPVLLRVTKVTYKLAKNGQQHEVLYEVEIAASGEKMKKLSTSGDLVREIMKTPQAPGES